MQKHVNLVDLVKSFPTNIFLQNLASIQKRTSLIKFAHLAEKSEKGSISNLSTKVLRGRARGGPALGGARAPRRGAERPAAQADTLKAKLRARTKAAQWRALPWKKLNNVEEDLGKTSGRPRENLGKASGIPPTFSAALWKNPEKHSEI